MNLESTMKSSIAKLSSTYLANAPVTYQVEISAKFHSLFSWTAIL